MEILVTGASGFLGSYVLERLLNNGHCVSIIKRPGSDMWRVEHQLKKIRVFTCQGQPMNELFNGAKFDSIIHLATAYGRKNESIEQMISSNILFPTELLEYGANNGLKSFINADSSMPSSYTFYAATKKGFLENMKFYGFEKGIKAVNLVVEYMYGPKDDLNKFIPFIMESMMRGKSVDASPGEQKRDFIYVDDAATAFEDAVAATDEIERPYSTYEVGTGLKTSLKGFVEKVGLVVAVEPLVKWGALPYRKNELLSAVADPSKAKEDLGWTAKVSLEDGIDKTVKWYKENRGD